ncbi:SUPPRESSOR OF GAMMA RESPONSE 1-like [Chenopodium quinoa]|uniref:SUPPRESSOR OF GAMMA RESPONSE 1-like n=1 Tax=Chenopodium quinoa TaxID=63459 RepID=UPI000B7780E8|nr:SUPPRESSOR OF GAMMA RESPONSE 1-like [Chenopodium quinoa]
MSGRSWLVDGNRFATKIKCASGSCDVEKIKWKSNPTRSCPRCEHTIDNNDVVQEWPGLPRGVKFDPTDQEIIQHLIAKSGIGNEKPHPFIDEFIPTVDEEDGICYTHPKNLPGVKQDGNATHFFHRAIKAYSTGTRKRRKIHGDDLGDVRWHKTGRTKPVNVNGEQKGCKKIMVLYVTAKGGKAEKTSWVMHQYHLGTEEDEKDGAYVISKVFYQQQQQQVKQSVKTVGYISDVADDIVPKVDPVTPEPPRNEMRLHSKNQTLVICGNSSAQECDVGFVDEMQQHEITISSSVNDTKEDCADISSEDPVGEHDDNQVGEEKWWDSESQYLLNSQQLVEGLSLCDELLQSQSPNRDESADDVRKRSVLSSEYARLGPEDLKKDLEECQNLELDPANIDLDTPPDFRLSQLEFGSQDSFSAWGLGKMTD